MGWDLLLSHTYLSRQAQKVPTYATRFARLVLSSTRSLPTARRPDTSLSQPLPNQRGSVQVSKVTASKPPLIGIRSKLLLAKWRRILQANLHSSLPKAAERR